MKTRLIFFLLCISSLSVMAQGTIKREKCNTCGKIISQCQYKGKHPVKSQQEKPKTQQPAKQNTVKTKTANATKPTTGTLNGHEWVDLGLSVKWATCNVGANSPGDYGDYYAWGETITKSRYDWENCFDCLDSTGKLWSTYKGGGQTKITPFSGHDTAQSNWGGSWRMPTSAEAEELCKKCVWTWRSRYGHNGFEVTGPNGNSIFLPASGFRRGYRTYELDEDGHYWTSEMGQSNADARTFHFCMGTTYSTMNNYRSNGRSVRPVTE